MRSKLAGVAAACLAVALLYPLSGLFAQTGSWRWDADVTDSSVASIRVSLGLTSLAMLIVVLLGTPIAIYIARRGVRERLWWQAVFLVSILLPPLALGILLSITFGRVTNTPAALSERRCM